MKLKEKFPENFRLRSLRALFPHRADYRDVTWRIDILAGITVGIVALPLALAFGITTGVGASSGLITAVLAGLIAAIFGGSHLQVSGPTGAMTVVLVPLVSKYGLKPLPALGILAGAILIVASLLGLGKLINKVPWTVMEGFTLGIAMVIGLQQLPMALDVVKAHGDRTLPVAFHTLSSAISAGLNWKSIGIVGATLAIKFATPHLLKIWKISIFIPGSFLSIVLMTAALWNVHVAKIGSIPKKLWNTEALSHGIFSNLGAPLSAIILAALSIAALSGIESLLSARVADQMAHHQNIERTNPQRELFGQGLATIVASTFGGIPATGAIARTSVNVRSGARSRIAAITHSLFLILVIMSLGPIISHVPSASLAAVLIGTSIRIASPARMIELLKTTWQSAVVLLATAFSVLLIDLIWGIAIGLVLNLLINRLAPSPQQ